MTELPSLAGRFFHTLEECPCGREVAGWQGLILAADTPETLEVEIFSWLSGESWGTRLLSLRDFMDRNPVLYRNAEEMRFAYEHGPLAHSAGFGLCLTFPAGCGFGALSTSTT